jgi:hypothetical protein
LTLPYPGYSWSFNHHMGRVNSREVFALLESAYRFRQYPNYRTFVNQVLVTEGVFTVNIRADSGQVDAWRDYQQILPDLGLIYSTRYIKQPQLTQIGLMYIDGTIGYSELFSTQVLAYQYPNGHKTDISPAVKEKLTQAGISVPPNRIELDVNSGILIKPGVLILQVLVELHRQSYSPTLDTRECLLSLVPTIRNSDWQEAYARLLQLRQTGDTSEADKRRLRDVQEWFQFVDVEKIIQGRERLRYKTRQHQEIIARLAARLIELSYNLAEDPNSVDLLAEKNGLETIFEVKTINRRNFQPRIRLGDSYFSYDINMGLLCFRADKFLALTDGAIELELQNEV